MLITFDLDGVIADTDKWFFRLLNILRFNSDCFQVELDYYASRPLKYHPSMFLANGDTGYIITARKPHGREVTEHWLGRHGITLPLLFIDHDDEIDWTHYEDASVIAAGKKAEAITKLIIEQNTFARWAIHFDNNPFIVRELRIREINAILIGGDRCWVTQFDKEGLTKEGI